MSTEPIDNLDELFAELREENRVLRVRMLIERDLADYWYVRYSRLENDRLRYGGVLGD
jgi:hypothetical protein